jgi:hypothetical protein
VFFTDFRRRVAGWWSALTCAVIPVIRWLVRGFPSGCLFQRLGGFDPAARKAPPSKPRSISASMVSSSRDSSPRAWPVSPSASGPKTAPISARVRVSTRAISASAGEPVSPLDAFCLPSQPRFAGVSGPAVNFPHTPGSRSAGTGTSRAASRPRPATAAAACPPKPQSRQTA